MVGNLLLPLGFLLAGDDVGVQYRLPFLILNQNTMTDKEKTPTKSLNDFEDFMAEKYSDWRLASETGRLLNYEKQQNAQKGSCFVTVILLMLGILPGVLYAYYSSKPAKTLHFTVKIKQDGTLSASGDHEGTSIFDEFSYRSGEEEPQEGESSIMAWAKRHKMVIFILVFALIMIILASTS